MSKTDSNFTPEEQARIDKINKAAEDSLKGLKGFFSQEFIKIATGNNGVIDRQNKQFADAINSFANSPTDIVQDPNKVAAAVISIPDSKNKVTGDIDKFIASKVNAGASLEVEKARFAEVRNKLATSFDNFSQEFTTQTKDTEGIRALVKDRLKEQALNQAAYFKLGNDGKPMGITPEEKSGLVEKFKEHVKFPDSISSFLKQGEEKMMENTIAPLVNNNIRKYFSNNAGGGQVSTIDITKTTNEDSLKKFGQAVSSDLEAFSILKQSVGKSNEKFTLSKDDEQKLIQTLVPALSAKGNDYLAKNSDKLVQEMTQSFSIVKQSVDKLGQKFNLSKDDELKLIQTLVPALSAKGDEYLAKNSDKLVQEVTKSLESKKSFSVFNRGTYKISDKNLNRLASELGKKQIEAENPRPSPQRHNSAPIRIREEKEPNKPYLSWGPRDIKRASRTEKTSPSLPESQAQNRDAPQSPSPQRAEDFGPRKLKAALREQASKASAPQQNPASLPPQDAPSPSSRVMTSLPLRPQHKNFPAVNEDVTTSLKQAHMRPQDSKAPPAFSFKKDSPGGKKSPGR